MKRIIVHVSEVEINKNGGMSRIEYYWKKAFEDRGFEFIHIGNKETGKVLHKSFFSLKAYRYYKRLKIKPVAFIIHEPSAVFFLNKKIPVFIESHGIERQSWQYELKQKDNNISIRTKFLFPIWRLLQCDIALRKANKLLLTNTTDKEYAIANYKRSEKDIFIFKNGVEQNFSAINSKDFVVLFNGSWIKRKGIHTLVKAADILYNRKRLIKYLLIGTGKSENEVLQSWPDYLKQFVKVISKFEASEEEQLLNQSSVVVLPSYFEGQPLSILQAMAAGKCCITTNCCGQKDYIINNETGLLFERGNAEELAKLIDNCYENFNIVTEVGNKAKISMKHRNWIAASNEVVDFVTRFL